MKYILFLLPAFLIFMSSLVLAEEEDEKIDLFPIEKAQTAPIENISRGVFKIGDVLVDQNKKQIVLKGIFNQVTWNQVEYLVVCQKGGKAHESVLTIDIEPIHLQLACLLLNLKYGKPLEDQGDPNTPKGDSVEIFVEWQEKGEKKGTKRVRAEELLYSMKKKKVMEKTNWIYTGSRFDEENRFLAQITKNVIACYNDPDALFNNPLKEGGISGAYIINEKQIAEPETKVDVIIQVIQKKEEKK